MKHDINTFEDISLLVDSFYDRVLNSPTLQLHFSSLHWAQHLPKMKKFWAFILLDEPGYTENVTEKHLKMKLSNNLFEEWVSLFNQTVDHHFEGERAEMAKERAQLISWGIQAKMGLLKN